MAARRAACAPRTGTRDAGPTLAAGGRFASRRWSTPARVDGALWGLLSKRGGHCDRTPRSHPRCAMPQMKAVANPNATTVNGSSRQSIHMDCSRMNGLLSASEQHAPFAAVVGHIPERPRPRCLARPGIFLRRSQSSGPERRQELKPRYGQASAAGHRLYEIERYG